MEGDLRIPLSRIPDEGLDLDMEVAPEALELEEGRWPPLWDARLIGRLERTGPREAVLRGRVLGAFLLECSLGLARFECRVEEPLVVYFLSPPAGAGLEAGEEVELEEKELEVAFIEDEAVNLAPSLRDQLGLAIPLQPKCPGKCLGEDPELCRRLEAGEGVGAEEFLDPRWSALRAWRK